MRRTGSLEALRETTAMEATADEWPEGGLMLEAQDDTSTARPDLINSPSMAAS